jgi:hypothetical protein
MPVSRPRGGLEATPLYGKTRPSADFGERQVYGNPATLLLLLEAGFVTQATRNENTRVAQASAAWRAADERAWLALDWPVRGQMVCRDDGRIRYVSASSKTSPTSG